MPEGLITLSYLVASVFFIMSLGGLSKQESSKRGNYYGIIGMSIAILATVLSDNIKGFDNYIILFLIISIGAIIGILVGKKVEMSSMPELVAILHSFVGASAVLVGIVSYLESELLVGSKKCTVGALLAL